MTIEEMTEELKEEAEEKAGIYFDSLDYDHGDVSDTPFSGYDVFVAYEKGALDFAEPREKQIAELERKLKVETELSNRLGLAYREYEQLTKEQDEHLAELEAQIEKMKCCYNCKHSRTEYEHCKTDKSEKWEIKEK